jgi:hypothetical protein
LPHEIPDGGYVSPFALDVKKKWGAAWCPTLWDAKYTGVYNEEEWEEKYPSV